jgi:polyhydroxybutyrate depolymerase
MNCAPTGESEMKKMIVTLCGLAVLFLLYRAHGQSSASMEKIDVNGVERSYIVHVPQHRQQDALVLALHGGYGQASEMNGLTGFSQLADREGFIVVYPDGINHRWNDGRETIPDKVDDISFISKLIDRLVAQYRIDPNRVYVTGISNGGFMSLRVACDLSDKVSAIASVAASMAENRLKICKPPQPVSVFLLNGTDDPIVPYGGGAVRHRGKFGYGGEIISAPESAKYWADLDDCSKTPEDSTLADVRDDGTRIESTLYSKGQKDTDVLLYSIHGGGHAWPGGLQYLPAFLIGKTTRDIDGSAVIWKFFKDHPRR